jgi:hypothetical protein
MIGSLVLLALAPAAPVPKVPAPVEVTAKAYAYPPQLVPGAAGPELFNIDDGHFVEVTVKNISKEPIAVPYTRKLRERVNVVVTDAKGAVVSDPKRHLGFRRVNDVPKVHELKPSDSFTVVVHLEDNWPTEAERRAPGKYTARVVFECDKIRAESAATFPLEITK